MKKTRTQKGITLVALIITIIVLLILAVVSINAIKGDGIIAYAQNAKEQYEQAATNEQIALNALIEQIEDNMPQETVVHSGIVPKGAVYTTGRVWDEDAYSWDETNVVTFNEGDEMPDEPQKGDMYTYGDYKYIYEGWFNPGGYSGDDSMIQQGAWDAYVLDESKSEYGDILLSINNKPLSTALRYTWYNCTNISKLVIPEGVIITNGAPDGKIKSLTIPSSFEYVGIHSSFGNSYLEDIYYDGTIVEFESILNNKILDANGGWGYQLNCTLHLSDGTSVVINYEYEAEFDESGTIISAKYVSKN